MKKNKLQNPHKPTPVSQSGKIKPKIEDVSIKNHEHPVFCFRYIHKEYSLDKCDADEKTAFIEQIIKLSQMTWQNIQLAPKHGLGSEKISVNSLKAKCTEIVTDDVSHLLAFRFIGKKPFVGFRDKFLFHVIFIDRNHEVY